jgi:hypothetical protein
MTATSAVDVGWAEPPPLLSVATSRLGLHSSQMDGRRRLRNERTGGSVKLAVA